MEYTQVKSYSPIFIGKYPFHQKLKDELVPILEEYPDQQNRSTNVQATMTEYDWDPKSDRVKRLQECIIAEAYSHIIYKDLKIKCSIKLAVDDFWANIYNKGDYTHSHHHIGLVSSFGFVYFLKTKWYHPSLVFSDSGKKMKPKEGTYIIFPNHLMHHVPKNRFKETRITLSGNLNIKKS